MLTFSRLGAAVPHPTLLGSVPVNPIQWSLSLLRPDAASAGPSVFGGGFLSDCADIPGEPVLLYSLSGSWEPRSEGETYGRVFFSKVYSHPSARGVEVAYSGDLYRGEGGAWMLGGSWVNDFEMTRGRFACQLVPSTT